MTSETLEVAELAEDLDELDATGYGPASYFAARYIQGGRQVYSIDLSISDLVDNIRRPDPEVRLEGNRIINVAHAKSFARYISDYPNWTAPPLLLRVPSGEVSFEPIKRIDGADWGLLKIPRAARDELNIVDGQHRVLGAHMARELLASELRKARDHLARTKSNGELPQVLTDAERKVNSLKEVRQRFESERMTLQIVEEDDPDAYRQMFTDIASNALGISQSVQNRFDSRKVVNRCLEPVITQSGLLKDLVDIDRDRISGRSRHLLSAKHVADIIRILVVGPTGRIGRRMEDELKEGDVIRQSVNFFDLLTSAYPDYRDLTDPESELDVVALRQRSMLGSVTMIRLLAGVYWTLMTGADEGKPMSAAEVRDFFHSLDMSAPVPETSRWRSNPDWFDEPYTTPSAKRQLAASLLKEVSRWARE